MRTSIVIALSFAALVFTANGASARLVQVGWVSESDLKKKCGANGGDWSSGESGYSCGKKCDGGKDYCVYG